MIEPEKYIQNSARISDAELYSLFCSDVFYDLTPEVKLLLLQLVENRKAMEAGRQPARILLIPMDQVQPGVAGFHTVLEDGSHVICVSPAFFMRELSEFFTPMMLLNTIFHEGRHALQVDAIADTDRNGYGLNPEIFLRWLAESVNYSGSSPWYGMQFIEFDARMKALFEIIRLDSVFTQAGVDTTDVKIEISRAISEETAIVLDILQNVTVADLEKHELECRQKLLNATKGKYVIPPDFQVCFLYRFILENAAFPAERLVTALCCFHAAMEGIQSVEVLLKDFSDLNLTPLLSTLEKLGISPQFGRQFDAIPIG